MPIEIIVPCQLCKKDFTRKSGAQKYCSPDCRFKDAKNTNNMSGIILHRVRLSQVKALRKAQEKLAISQKKLEDIKADSPPDVIAEVFGGGVDEEAERIKDNVLTVRVNDFLDFLDERLKRTEYAGFKNIIALFAVKTGLTQDDVDDIHRRLRGEPKPIFVSPERAVTSWDDLEDDDNEPDEYRLAEGDID